MKNGKWIARNTIHCGNVNVNFLTAEVRKRSNNLGQGEKHASMNKDDYNDEWPI